MKGVYKKGNGWIVDKEYRINEGGMRIQFRAKTQKRAIEKMTDRMADIDKLIRKGITIDNKEVDMDYLFDLYAKENAWALNSTTKKRRQQFFKYCDELRKMKVKNITEEKIRNWYMSIERKVNKEKIQRHYATKIYRVIKGIFRMAFENGYILKELDLDYIMKKRQYKQSHTNPLCNTNYITESNLKEICEKIYLLPL